MRRWLLLAGPCLAVVVGAGVGARAGPSASRGGGPGECEAPEEINGWVLTARRSESRLGTLSVPEGALAYRDDLCASTRQAVVASVLRTEPGNRRLGLVVRVATVVRLFVERVVHGQAGPWLQLEVAQGEHDGLWFNLHLPRFASGQRYLFLLGAAGQTDPHIRGGGRALVALDPGATLPSQTAAETAWAIACRSKLDVPQRRLPEVL